MKGEANLLLEMHLKERGLSFEPEWRFNRERRWRLDYVVFAKNEAVLAGIEIEGAVFANGRHTRGKGFEADCIKYNTFSLSKIPLFRFTTGQIKRGEDIPFLEMLCPVGAPKS